MTQRQERLGWAGRGGAGRVPLEGDAGELLADRLGGRLWLADLSAACVLVGPEARHGLITEPH